MKQYFLLIASIFFLTYHSPLKSESTSTKQTAPSGYCSYHYLCNLCPRYEQQTCNKILDFIPRELLNLIPPRRKNKHDPCLIQGCSQPASFGRVRRDHVKYISPICVKYIAHLKQHLEYCNRHRECTCYWPEYSRKADEIADLAKELFEDILENSALLSLSQNRDEQRNFTKIQSREFFGPSCLSRVFTTQQFYFSSYYHVCRDLEEYAQSKYSAKEVAKIKDKLENIIEALYPRFFDLYQKCFAAHPNAEINQEIRFMKLLVGDAGGAWSNAQGCSINFWSLGKEKETFSKTAKTKAPKKCHLSTAETRK